jgi:hypothetical protein
MLVALLGSANPREATKAARTKIRLFLFILNFAVLPKQQPLAAKIPDLEYDGQDIGEVRPDSSKLLPLSHKLAQTA